LNSTGLHSALKALHVLGSEKSSQEEAVWTRRGCTC